MSNDWQLRFLSLDSLLTIKQKIASIKCCPFIVSLLKIYPGSSWASEQFCTLPFHTLKAVGVIMSYKLTPLCIPLLALGLQELIYVTIIINAD